MNIFINMGNEAILSELGSRIAGARLNLNLTQIELAEQAGVSKRTVERAEAGGSTQLSSFIRLCRALGLVERFDSLLPVPVPSPLEQLKLQGKRRRRASHKVSEPLPGKWTWNDKHGA